ncbi:hypothetical protein Tco_0578419 [Tanacetum coccineum]
MELRNASFFEDIFHCLSKETGSSSRLDDKVVQDKKQRDDNDLQDERLNEAYVLMSMTGSGTYDGSLMVWEKSYMEQFSSSLNLDPFVIFHGQIVLSGCTTALEMYWETNGECMQVSQHKTPPPLDQNENITYEKSDNGYEDMESSSNELPTGPSVNTEEVAKRIVPQPPFDTEPSSSLPLVDDERPNGIRPLKIQRPGTPLIDAVAAHDKSKIVKLVYRARVLFEIITSAAHGEASAIEAAGLLNKLILQLQS